MGVSARLIALAANADCNVIAVQEQWYNWFVSHVRDENGRLAANEIAEQIDDFDKKAAHVDDDDDDDVEVRTSGLLADDTPAVKKSMKGYSKTLLFYFLSFIVVTL